MSEYEATLKDLPVLACTDLGKSFRQGPVTLTVLAGLQLSVQAGETVAILGASGSGKTTLLQLMGALDVPTTGEVLIGGENPALLGEAARGWLRNRQLGFVYQFHHLLPEFTALENVAMPLLIRHEDRRAAFESARAVLDRVGLGARLGHRPSELSGGERQRAAVARALVTRPPLVLADEPTGNLDSANANQVLELMLELNREWGSSLVIVTHDGVLAERLQRRLVLEDGKLRELSG